MTHFSRWAAASRWTAMAMLFALTLTALAGCGSRDEGSSSDYASFPEGINPLSNPGVVP